MRKLLFLMIASFGVVGCDPQPVVDAEKAVRRSMKDPDSTQFRDVAVCDGAANLIKGYYNSKNEMGGYGGFKPFYYSDHVVTVEDGEFTEFMKKCYSNLKFNADGSLVETSASQ